MRKYLSIFIYTSSIAIFTVLAVLVSPRTVKAQCGQPTQCNTCHNIQGELPVHENGAWHLDHMPYNACHVCHGGDKTSPEASAAHVNIVSGLEQMQAGCAECHTGADLQANYSQYADQLGVTGEIDLTSIQSNLGGQNAGPFSIAGPAVTTTSQPTTNGPVNSILAGVLALIMVGGGSYVYTNERRLRQASRPETTLLAWIWSRLRKENWSPYAAGILLGIAGILAVAIGDRLLSASGGIATITSSLLSALAPEVAAEGIYFKFIYPPGFSWPVALLVGVFIGGLLSAISSGAFRLRWNDDSTWQKVFGKSRWKRFAIGFIGAVILQYGAGIAGGCTSGLAISGGMLLAPSAFLFMGGMFAAGILVAVLIYRRRY